MTWQNWPSVTRFHKRKPFHLTQRWYVCFLKIIVVLKCNFPNSLYIQSGFVNDILHFGGHNIRVISTVYFCMLTEHLVSFQFLFNQWPFRKQGYSLSLTSGVFCHAKWLPILPERHLSLMPLVQKKVMFACMNVNTFLRLEAHLHLSHLLCLHLLFRILTISPELLILYHSGFFSINHILFWQIFYIIHTLFHYLSSICLFQSQSMNLLSDLYEVSSLFHLVFVITPLFINTNFIT